MKLALKPDDMGSIDIRESYFHDEYEHLLASHRCLCIILSIINTKKMRTSMASRSVRFDVQSRKLSNVGQSLDG
jgi:hypothetical protein